MSYILKHLETSEFVKKFYYILCVYVHVCICMHVCVHVRMRAHAHAVLLVWRSEGNLEELVLSFYHVVPGIQIQAVRLGGKYLCPLKSSFEPWLYF